MTALYLIAILAALGVLSFADSSSSSLAVAAREQVDDEESDGIEAEPEGAAKEETIEDQYDHEPSDEDDEEGSEASAPDAEKEESDESEESGETPNPEDRGFDENLLALAKRFDISRENALEYSSPGDLLRTITQLNAIRQTKAKTASAAQANGQGEGKQETQERPKPPKFEFNLKSLGLNPDNLPDEVVSGFDKLGGTFGQYMGQVNDFWQQQVEGMQTVMGKLIGHFDEMSQQAQAAEQMKFADWFDGKVKALGGEWEKELGKGTWRSLKDSDPALATRERVIEAMGKLRDLFPNDSDDELLQRALSATFTKKQAAVTTKKIREGLQANASQQTRKPNPKGKGAGGGDPYAKAARKVEKFQRSASAGRTTWDDGDDEV